MGEALYIGNGPHKVCGTNNEAVQNCLTELYARTLIALKLQICNISSIVTSSVTVAGDSEAPLSDLVNFEGAAVAKMSAAEGVWPPKSCATILFAKVYNSYLWKVFKSIG